MSPHLYSQHILLPFTPEVVAGVESAYALEIGEDDLRLEMTFGLDAMALDILRFDPNLADRLMNLDQAEES